MADESAGWRVTVRWPYTPVEGKGKQYHLQWNLDHPEEFWRAVQDVYPVHVESFEVGPRSARLVVTATTQTIRPQYQGDRRRFRSSAQEAVDLAIDAACYAATLNRFIERGNGLPEPVRFEVRSAA